MCGQLLLVAQRSQSVDHFGFLFFKLLFFGVIFNGMNKSNSRCVPLDSDVVCTPGRIIRLHYSRILCALLIRRLNY